MNVSKSLSVYLAYTTNLYAGGGSVYYKNGDHLMIVTKNMNWFYRFYIGTLQVQVLKIFSQKILNLLVSLSHHT